jgi:hypothetical protein
MSGKSSQAGLCEGVMLESATFDAWYQLLSASRYDDTIAWYENNGKESFTAHVVTTSADYAVSVFAADVDGDGDILSASGIGGTIAWYENDGRENFTAHDITTTAVRPSSVYAADVDGDGDLDVLSSSINDHTIAWYENDGNENFTRAVRHDILHFSARVLAT